MSNISGGGNYCYLCGAECCRNFNHKNIRWLQETLQQQRSENKIMYTIYFNRTGKKIEQMEEKNGKGK